VKANTLTTAREEQVRLLDLLEVFRVYTETGHLENASSIIASQVASLEVGTRKMENKAKPLNSANSTNSGQKQLTKPLEPLNSLLLFK
jgi:hypothetical protein